MAVFFTLYLQPAMKEHYAYIINQHKTAKESDITIATLVAAVVPALLGLCSLMSISTGDPTCTWKGTTMDIFEYFAIKACCSLFKVNMSGIKVNIWDYCRDDGDELQSNAISVYFFHIFDLEGDVSNMDEKRRKYAFRSREAKDV
ncbi:hypothetical protein CC78DRAFT_575216 [Lojkania enalia]|uniref:Uncharacterized protein n=1 Tax=Lojkania enalia TaxID=147567 RepID=A0A9P4N9J8_9PLEO|nr:hypothetical protein CC78DRAFT_575216 [Didymosphaeria enalia]